MSATDISSTVITRGQYTGTVYRPDYWTATGSKIPGTYSSSVVNNKWAMRTIITRAGTVTPRFRFSRSFPLTHNNFFYSKETLKAVSGFESLRAGGSGVVPDTETSGSGYFVTDDASGAWYRSNLIDLTAGEISSLDAAARNKILNRIKDQKINIAQFVAEREQTIRLVTETITRFASAARNLRKGNIRAAAKNLGVHISNRGAKKFSRDFARNQSKSLANGWLQLQYGWKPLMQDVRGAAEQLAALQDDIVYKSAHASETYTKDGSNSFTIVADYQRRVTEKSLTEYTIKYSVFYRQDLKLSNMLAKVGLTNPALIAWELTPFSFVIDWFLPVGDFLSSLDATVGLTFVRGSKTTFINQRASRNIASYSVTYGGGKVTSQFSGWKTKIVNQRESLVSFPSIGLPSFKNPLSLTHMANAFALLRNQFRR